jgi:hypothetical protein
MAHFVFKCNKEDYISLTLALTSEYFLFYWQAPTAAPTAAPTPVSRTCINTKIFEGCLV